MPEPGLNTSAAARPPRQVVLGFDFGQRRIGVAIGDTLTGSARPLCTLSSRQQTPDWAAISQLITEWQPDRLVVGVPRHADETANALTAAALEFSCQLQSRFQRAVDTIDERLSSWEAEQRRSAAASNRRRQRTTPGLDAEAAAVILESWFNQPRSLA